MGTEPLPDNPDLDRLGANAELLRDLVRSGADGAVALVREHHPRLDGLVAGTAAAAALTLSDARLTLARHHGYPSWSQLGEHVALVNRLTRSPHEQPIGTDLGDDAARADELLRLACLTFGADGPTRWRDAARLLARHPHLGRASIHTIAAVGDAEGAADVLAADPAAASVEGGPFAWEPLLYLTYSRLRPEGADPVAVARLLLDAGADPNAGYLWDGLPSPFTALTGVFGHGEQGAPEHPDEMALARMLLEEGAEANDSQTAYDRGLGDIATDDTDWLELLLAFGLGRGDGGPWRRRLPLAHQDPTEIAGDLLQHAAEHGLVERTRMLLEGGVDPGTSGSHPCFEERSPYESAVLFGNREVADLLAVAGADTRGVDEVTRFVGLCLAADRPAVDAAVAADPALLALVRDRRGDLVARAAERGRPHAVRLLVELGFDVNARHRTTALHEAALRGDLDVAAVLLDQGADPTIVDESHDSTPQGWAEHNGQTEVIALLDEWAGTHPLPHPLEET